MIKRQDFIEQNEQLISETYEKTLSQVASVLEHEGYIDRQFRFACVPGVVIEIKNRLTRLFEANGWTVEINFNHSRPESELYIRIF